MPRSADSTLDMEGPIEDPRPSANPIEMETVRARAEAALFGRVAPAKFGRYHIIERIAGGGMGVVYAAYDPDLDRRVALKVVHPKRTHDERAQGRLITEARALAKLDHPNVVKVHDVVTHEGTVVIVMELVVGETLAAWAQQPQTWREAVRLYQQAAQGLVAAHGVGVVHRDFKPSNAIIGADGRVRVLDFGLARFGEVAAETGQVNQATPASNLTETGDILGTLSYAAPEQLRGETTTAASDQFSWCVSLHHAVEGVAPFTGNTPEERLRSIEAKTVTLGEASRDVPAWLRALIARGLSPDPNDRYPDMAALVGELLRPRGWRRYRIPMLAAGVFGIGIATTLLVRGAPDDECDGGRGQLERVWNSALRETVRHMFDAIDAPYSREVRDRVIAGLDRYANDWSDSHLAACRDHRRGAISPDLLDRRMICLEERLSDLHAATSVVNRSDGGSLPKVVDVVANMPAIARCSDLERLRSDVEPPEGELLRERVRIVRNKISEAEALARAGRSEPARKAATDALDGAIATPYPPVQVEAALAQSRTLMAFGEIPAAAKPLGLARQHALELQMIPAAVEAGARLIYVDAMHSSSRTIIEHDAAVLEPLSKLPSCSAFARPLLLNNIGVAYLSAGDRARAFAYFQEARGAVRAGSSADLELTVVDRNLALLTVDDVERSQLATSVVERFREALGPTHPTTLEAISAAAEYEVDPAKAYALIRSSTEAYRTFHPTLIEASTQPEAARAFLAGELDDASRARVDYQTAIARLAQSSDPNMQVLHQLLIGELALLQRDPDAAERAFLAARDKRASSTAWWEKIDLYRAELGIGAAAIVRGKAAIAIPHLEAAIAGFASVMEMNELMLYRRLQARAQRLLAGVLRARGDVARADQLDRAARSFYARGPVGYAWLMTPAKK